MMYSQPWLKTLLVVEIVIVSNLGITKDVKNVFYCCYVRCATLLVRIGDMPQPKTDPMHNNAELRLQDEGRAIKEFVVCYLI